MSLAVGLAVPFTPSAYSGAEANTIALHKLNYNLLIYHLNVESGDLVIKSS